LEHTEACADFCDPTLFLGSKLRTYPQSRIDGILHE